MGKHLLYFRKKNFVDMQSNYFYFRYYFGFDKSFKVRGIDACLAVYPPLWSNFDIQNTIVAGRLGILSVSRFYILTDYNILDHKSCGWGCGGGHTTF